MKIITTILSFILAKILWPIVKESLRLLAILALKATIILLIALKDVVIMLFMSLVIGSLKSLVKVLV